MAAVDLPASPACRLAVLTDRRLPDWPAGRQAMLPAGMPGVLPAVLRPALAIDDQDEEIGVYDRLQGLRGPACA